MAAFCDVSKIEKTGSAVPTAQYHWYHRYRCTACRFTQNQRWRRSSYSAPVLSARAVLDITCYSTVTPLSEISASATAASLQRCCVSQPRLQQGSVPCRAGDAFFLPSKSNQRPRPPSLTLLTSPGRIPSCPSLPRVLYRWYRMLYQWYSTVW